MTHACRIDHEPATQGMDYWPGSDADESDLCTRQPGGETPAEDHERPTKRVFLKIVK